MEDRIKGVMAAVFGISADEIADDASPHDIKSWDSIKHMNLVLALEEEFDIKFEDAEIPSLVNFQIIAATVKAYAE
jgi:acyl carrier protein